LILIGTYLCSLDLRSVLVDDDQSFTLLPFPGPSSAAGGRNDTVVAEVSVVEHQRQVVAVFAVFLGGDANARATVQGGEESRCNAVDEPHGHAIKLSATGGGLR